MGSRISTWFAAAAITLPLAVNAEEFSYRYVDLAHIPSAEIDVGNSDVDGDGFQLRGSLPVYENFFVLVEHLNLDFDRGIDAARWMIGAGGHWPINNSLDVIARAGLVHYEVEAGPFDDDDNGFFIGGRLRAKIAPQIELEGGFEHVNVEVGDLGDETYLVAEGRYNFTSQLAAGVLLNVGGDTTLLGVQGRYSF